MQKISHLLIELDRLKSTYRRSYISDLSRNESSAEHSWHLAMGLLAFKDFMPPELDIDHALRIALAHDVCEIGPGDVDLLIIGTGGIWLSVCKLGELAYPSICTVPRCTRRYFVCLREPSILFLPLAYDTCSRRRYQVAESIVYREGTPA